MESSPEEPVSLDVGIAWFGALLVAGYLPVLQRLVHQWDYDDDMGHGFFVPVIAGFIVWQRSDELTGA